MAEKSVRIEPSERAQLMLVGAVAIALVIVGIVVVYNTVLYSDTQSATASLGDARQADAFTEQVEKEISILGRRLAESNNLSEPNLRNAIQNWSKIQAMSHANTNPVFVKVDFEGCPASGSGNCDPGSTVEADVIWESQKFGFQNTISVQIPAVGIGSTVYIVNSSGVVLGIDGNGSTPTPLTATDDARTFGTPNKDITGDGTPDIPYINSSGVLKITNSSGTETTLATNSDISGSIGYQKSRLGVGTWDGSPMSVFFVNQNHDTIYRVTASGSVVEVVQPDNGAQAISGIINVDGDQDKELVFADSSQRLRYIQSPGSCGGGTACSKMKDGQLGSSVGIGAGSIADFDDDGISTVVGIDGSKNIKIIGAPPSESGEGTTTITAVDAAKSPVTVADIDGDGDSEIIYVGNSNSFVKYVDDVGNSNSVKFLRDSNGNKISGEKVTGVV